MQYLIEEIREEGSSRVSRKGNVLMALLSPEFEQWKKEYDTCGIVRISRANLQACECLVPCSNPFSNTLHNVQVFNLIELLESWGF
jgi:hypothetical protein